MSSEVVHYTPAPPARQIAADLLPQVAPDILEQAMQIEDVAKMPPAARVAYYVATCLSVGLNPYTRPFDLIQGDDGVVRQYPNKSAAEQLRKRDSISIRVLSRVKEDGLYIVTVLASTPAGREEEAQGIVPLTKPVGTWESASSGKRYFKTQRNSAGEDVTTPLKGTELANAFMKAETKAKRRATLALAGLGFDDEPGGRPVTLDLTSGQISASDAQAVTATAQTAPVATLVGELFDAAPSPSVDHAEAPTSAPGFKDILALHRSNAQTDEWLVRFEAKMRRRFGMGALQEFTSRQISVLLQEAKDYYGAMGEGEDAVGATTDAQADDTEEGLV